MYVIRRSSRYCATVLSLILGGCATPGEQHGVERHGVGQNDIERHDVDGHDGGQHDAERHDGGQHDVERHDSVLMDTSEATGHDAPGHRRDIDMADRAVLQGQYAFATIGEIVALLEADPDTDWSSVDVEGLRQHLIDMERVTVDALVESQPIDGGARFLVRGSDAKTQASIRRMVSAHVQTMAGAVSGSNQKSAGISPWQYDSSLIDRGATLTVTTSDASDAERIRGLGFLGVMVRGSHHPVHHLALANGKDPHQRGH